VQIFVRSQVSVKASDVNLWWPVGMGSQPLYDLSVTYASWSTWSDLIGLIGQAIGSVGGSVNDLIGFSDPSGAQNPGAAGQPGKADQAAAAAAAAALKQSEDPATRRSLLSQDSRRGANSESEEVPTRSEAHVQHAPQYEGRAAAQGVKEASKEQQQQPSNAPKSKAAHAPQFPEEPNKKKKDVPNEQQPGTPTRPSAQYEPASVNAAHARLRRMVAEGKLSPAFFPGLNMIKVDSYMSTVNRRVGFRHVEVRVRRAGQ
jgi:hypothetical protein